MPSRSLRSAQRALLLPALAALLASLACASARILEPGVPAALAPDEGILVVHVETNTGVAELDFGWLRAATDLPVGQLAEVAVLRVQTKDGLEVESFLTRPQRFEGARPPSS